jgi:hypothetical protein
LDAAVKTAIGKASSGKNAEVAVARKRRSFLHLNPGLDTGRRRFHFPLRPFYRSPHLGDGVLGGTEELLLRDIPTIGCSKRSRNVCVVAADIFQDLCSRQWYGIVDCEVCGVEDPQDAIVTEVDDVMGSNNFLER